MYNVRNDETEIRRYGIKILPVDSKNEKDYNEIISLHITEILLK